MWTERASLPGAVFLGLLVCGNPGLAQDPAGRGEQLGHARSLDGDSASIEARGGEILGTGPDYRVQFERDRVVFTPALGKAAPRNLPLSFALAAVGRASEVTSAARPADLSHDATTARYGRPGCEEVYEVRPDGLEQSFVFHELPAGSGDLVVRGRIDTDLPVSRTANDEVVFEESGIGGVRIGAVVGFDATGRRVDGHLAFDGSQLEMRLPASFVDAAVLPLTLDPLINSFVVSASRKDEEPDVALDPGGSRYLVVWTRSFSASDSDIRARFVDRTGTAIGNTLSLRSTPGKLSFDAHVAFVASPGIFVVVWNEGGDVWAVGVESSTLTFSTSPLQVTAGADFEAMVDVGGEATTSDDRAIVVWANLSRGSIEAMAIRAFAGGGLAIQRGAAITTPGGANRADLQPAISRTGGSTGRYLIVWNRSYVAGSSLALEGDIRAMLVDRNLRLLQFMIIASSSDDEDDPDVDGDGTHWVVAWEAEVDDGSGDNDIWCRAVSAVASSTTKGMPVLVEGDADDDEINPAVAWLGDSVLVGYVDHGSGTHYAPWFKSLDPFTCTSCEGEFIPKSPVEDTRSIAIAAGGSLNVMEALIVFDPEDVGAGTQNIEGVRFRPEDGRVATFYGGTCIGGGEPSATCAVVGNGSFTLRTHGAEAFADAYLLVSPFASEYWCGSCRIVADPFAGVVVYAGKTDATGAQEVALPIPNAPELLGASLVSQWLVAAPGGCANFATSSALSVTIE